MEAWFCIVIIISLFLFLDNLSKAKKLEQMKNDQPGRQNKKHLTQQIQPQYAQIPTADDEMKKLIMSLASEVRDMKRAQIQQPPATPRQIYNQQNHNQPRQSEGYNGRHQYNSNQRTDGERFYN